MRRRPDSAPTAATSGSSPPEPALLHWRRRLRRIEVVRDLPWRQTRDPWAILVAEVMLQQTQVTRVIPAWRGFLETFPSPVACASASRADLIAAWAGMGYHRRAVALHRCAAQITSAHGGEVPSSLDDLLALPGIGPYTARAVLAFAFEADVAVVDTNVARILARAVVGAPLGGTAAQRTADALVTRGRGWAHNQAMLDLGALWCRPSPDCGSCPLRRSCEWHRRGRPAPDPSHGSAGVSRPQGRFEGSDRQLRGRILGLARAVSPAWAELEVLGEDAARVDRLACQMEADGLVELVGRQVRLPLPGA